MLTSQSWCIWICVCLLRKLFITRAEVVKNSEYRIRSITLNGSGTARIHHWPGVVYIICNRPLSSPKTLRTTRICGWLQTLTWVPPKQIKLVNLDKYIERYCFFIANTLPFCPSSFAHIWNALLAPVNGIGFICCKAVIIDKARIFLKYMMKYNAWIKLNLH